MDNMTMFLIGLIKDKLEENCIRQIVKKIAKYDINWPI